MKKKMYGENGVKKKKQCEKEKNCEEEGSFFYCIDLDHIYVTMHDWFGFYSAFQDSRLYKDKRSSIHI